MAVKLHTHRYMYMTVLRSQQSKACIQALLSLGNKSENTIAIPIFNFNFPGFVLVHSREKSLLPAVHVARSVILQYGKANALVLGTLAYLAQM